MSTKQRQYIRCYLPLKGSGLGWRCARALVAGMMMVQLTTGAHTQSLTPDPGAWRPLSYANLQESSPQTETYLDIWKDAIDANNRAYKVRGDLRYSHGNAPVTEAHFVIWSPTKSVVLSILNTVTGCTLKEVRPAAGATQVRTLVGGRACFLELASPLAGKSTDPDQAVSYASYDVATKTVKTGVVIDHHALDGCSQNIALYPQ